MLGLNLSNPHCLFYVVALCGHVVESGLVFCLHSRCGVRSRFLQFIYGVRPCSFCRGLIYQAHRMSIKKINKCLFLFDLPYVGA